ncbi:putative Sir2 family [Trypanosoma vivax]|nr:putative Sir2 family [Trypanosoma vivax]
MNKQGRFVAVLTGAGISAESGIPTFRGKDRLWENHRVVDVACPAAYARNPQLVQQFYNQRRRALLAPSVKPNAAHLALAKLERQYDAGSVVIITQMLTTFMNVRAPSAYFTFMENFLKFAAALLEKSLR